MGFPDRVLLLYRAEDTFIEFKRPGEKPTRIQTYWHGVLRMMGKRVEIVHTVAEFRALLALPTKRLN